MTYPSFSLRLFMADPIVSFRINPPVIRLVIHGFLISTILLLSGCGNSPINSSTSDTSGTPHPSTISLQPSTPSFRLHWLGKKRLSAESNATNFISIWNMPESLRLESQTLDKLSTAPWRLLTTITTLSNAPSALLRPLLDDLIQEESYVEVSASMNAPAEIVLAIKLPADRVALWRTNLPLILNSLQPSTFNVQPLVTNIGNWTILSISDIRLQTSDVRLLSQVRHRLSTIGLPFAPETTNFWISGRVDFSWLSKAFSWNLKSITNLPVCEFSAIGDGTNVRSLATLTFPGKVPIELEPWNIPTNLVVEPICGLTLARSIGQMSLQMGILSPDQAAMIPRQFSIWQRVGAPVQIHFATAVTSNLKVLVDDFVPKIVERVNLLLDHRKVGSLTMNTNGMLVRWDGLMLAAPYFKVSTNATGQFYHAAFGLLPPRSKPLPKELHDHVLGDTNTLYFEWEHTGQTLPNWRYLDDASRMVFDNAHVPRFSSGHASIDWIKHNLTNLSHSISKLRINDDSSLSFSRKSTFGLNGLELAILAHWLETPQFPGGFDTLWKTNPSPFNVRFRRSSTPANN